MTKSAFDLFAPKRIARKHTAAALSAAVLVGGVSPVALPARPAVAQTATASAQSKPSIDEAVRLTSFRYIAGRPLKSVSVAGTFNNWNKDATPLKLDADGRTWRVAVPLREGKYQYKFVLDGETWVTDPNAPNESDGNGNTNSVLRLVPSDYATPARTGDGVIAQSALKHDADDISYRNYDRGALLLSLRARPNDLTRVTLVANKKRIAMQQAVSGAPDDLYTRWTAKLPWDRKSDVAYTFEIGDGPKIVSFGAGAPFTISAKTFAPFTVPAWVEKSVIYQIFPDRFANGDAKNDPKNVEPWDATPTYGNRFGGDAVGVENHLDYLSGLGVSAVYFNPVFASPSNHRYETTDYKKIDPEFGTNADFAHMARAMDKRGIRTVMDFAFNHTAPGFAAFADVEKNGAASPYKDWYFIRSYPVKVGPQPNYEAWYGFPSMPKLNVMNPATTDYLLGVTDFWEAEIPLGGMRLDVANEVDKRFWRTMRTHLKAAHPDTWIVGEEWGDASAWLGGDQWDSVMNYPFRGACLGFFAENKTTPTEFANRLIGNYANYAPQVSRNLMNLLSSHDTPRFLTLCKSDAKLAQLAAVVQFTWVGTPSIYYGEEIGMEGGADPDNRRAMRWDLANDANAMLAFYKKLIAVRNQSVALQSGDPQILLTDDKASTLAYARVLDKDAAVVALNRSSETRAMSVPLPAVLQRAGTLTDALTGQKYAVSQGQKEMTVSLPARSAVVLLPAR